MDEIQKWEKKTKRCRVCRHYKKIEDFHFDEGSHDKRQPKCKSCNKRLSDGYYLANQERIRARRRERYQEKADREIQASLNTFKTAEDLENLKRFRAPLVQKLGRKIYTAIVTQLEAKLRYAAYLAEED